MKHAELLKELKKGKVRPAYLLAGEEPLLRDDAAAAIRAAVLDGSADDFNLDRLDGRRTSADQLRDLVRALPMMADRRLVVLQDPDAARGAAGKELCDAIAEILGDARALEQTVLVVIASKVDKRTAWVKAFGKPPAALLDCAPPKGVKGIASFIEAEAKSQGLALEPGVAVLMAERIGPQLLLLRHELEKVALLAGLGEAVRREHVEAATSHIAEDSVWDLLDAIADGRSTVALTQLARMTSGGAAPPMVLGALAAHFRKLARLRSGASVPGPPFVVKKLERQARRYSARRLVQCMQAIHDTDTALKGAAAIAPELSLERLVIGLAG